MAMDFDPNAASGIDSGLFGLPHGPEEAFVHVMGVPFEATTSYRDGTFHGPDSILAASRQIDLFDLEVGKPYERGIWMAPIDRRIRAWNGAARSLAEPIIAKGGAGPGDAKALAGIEEIGAELNELTHGFFAQCFDSGKLPVLVGGEHSVPFGAIRASAERFPGLGVLQFDAHADLRPAFEGMRWSHASIMHNVLAEVPGVGHIAQVGVRDLCEQEYDAIQAGQRVSAIFGDDLAEARRTGGMEDLVAAQVAALPDHIYISFDIDALDPTLCPNTGTPVPGGITWDETMLWLRELRASNKRIVGLDLNEVSPGPSGDPDGESWDAIVGSRLLYKLIGTAVAVSP